MSFQSTLIRAFALLSLTGAMLQPAARAQAPAPAVNTDPARAQVVLPEPANAALPSIILIGDSTVRNGHDDGQGKGAEGQWGWGNPLASHFNPARVNVVNRAVGGLSSRTYLTSGHWERTLAFVKRGDIVVMQFGHNDASPVNDDKRARGTLRGAGDDSTEIDNLLTGKRETVHSYGWYLRKFIADARAKGATPVVASLIPRKAWNEDGSVRRNRDDYGAWAAEVARLEKTGFIDLNGRVAQRYDEMGRAAINALFPVTVPEERIHTNWAGAVLNAEFVVAGLKALGDPRMPDFLKPAEDVRPVVDARSVREEAPRDASLPTLFLVGDSTVRSGGQNGAIGWGERIAPYFDTGKINVVNAAIGGRSSRTFYTEGRWERVLRQLKRGDTVLIQFGHNDGGRIGDPANKNRASVAGIGPETVEDTRPDGSKEQVHSFGWYMARYVADAKARGASVVIASPIPHRDKWQQGRDFADFAEWGKQVADAGGAQFMDLTMLVSDGYRAIGTERVDAFFSDARTHTNAAGAEFNAQRVVAGLKALPGNPLGQAFAEAGSCTRWGERGTLLHGDDFERPLTGYVSEYAHTPGNMIANRDGRLLIDVDSGATVWLDKPLSGDLLIAYTRRVVMAGGKNDRLSDLNQFWMARDPARGKLFTRSGKFEDYDDLDLYYAGVGGNSNTTTRLRRYGQGQRLLVAERNEPAFLLQPNRDYRIEIALYQGCTRLSIDGREVFAYRDPQPYTHGYFGFRSTWSRQTIDNLTIHQLK